MIFIDIRHGPKDNAWRETKKMAPVVALRAEAVICYPVWEAVWDGLWRVIVNRMDQ
jgi:hypothetical protein